MKHNTPFTLVAFTLDGFQFETGTFSSAEALIRLWDEQLGYIPPDEFIRPMHAGKSRTAIGKYYARI